MNEINPCPEPYCEHKLRVYRLDAENTRLKKEKDALVDELGYIELKLKDEKGEDAIKTKYVECQRQMLIFQNKNREYEVLLDAKDKEIVALRSEVAEIKKKAHEFIGDHLYQKQMKERRENLDKLDAKCKAKATEYDQLCNTIDEHKQIIIKNQEIVNEQFVISKEREDELKRLNAELKKIRATITVGNTELQKLEKLGTKKRFFWGK